MRRLVPLLLLVLALPASAAAEPALDGEFPVDAKPAQLAQGPDGNVWFLMEGGEFGRITPAGAVSDDFAMPGGAAPKDITAGPDRLWISYDDGIVEVDPADPGNPTAHPVAEVNTARGIAREADGDLWVVDDFDGTVVEIGSNGTFKREIPGETVNGNPPSGRDIALGSDGKLWWADAAGPAVQATDPVSGTTEGYAVSDGQVQEIGAGPAGQLAFSSPNAIVGRIATDGTISESSNPARDAFGVTFARDGAYWFAEFATDTLGRLTPDGTLTHPIQLPGDADPRHITTGANDTLWVSLEDLTNMVNPRIARITGVEPPPEEPQPGDDPPGTEDPPPPPPPPPPPADTVAPAVGPLSMVPLRLRVGRRARIRFTLSETAALTLRFYRVRGGRRRAGRCVKRSRAPRRAPRCRRFVRAGVLARQGVEGPNTLGFSGRVGGRRLRPGRYRLTLVARDAAGNVSTPRRLVFRILPPRVRTG